jgi:hypothetical protein
MLPEPFTYRIKYFPLLEAVVESPDPTYGKEHNSDIDCVVFHHRKFTWVT